MKLFNKLTNSGLVRNTGRKLRKLARMAVFPKKYSSKRYVSYLRSEGVSIGKNTEFYHPETCNVDTTRPCLVTIGDDVKITRGVTILSHDYGWNVLRNEYGEILGSAGKTNIENNVFIGNHSTILKGVTVGENVIIGANSLVNKDIPSNVVAAGNPAEPVMSLQNYYEKRRREYLGEAVEYAKSIQNQYGRKPVTEDFVEFFPLFLERDYSNIRPEFQQRLTDGEMLPDSEVDRFLQTNPTFDSFDDFLEYCDLD